MRALENEIAQLHRKNGILDKELLELDKNRVVESIEQKFRSSQDTFEFQIQKQRERFQQFVKEFKLYSKYLKWMQSSDVSSPKQQKRGAKKRKGVGEGLIGDLPVDYHLENVKQEVFGVYKVFNQELETIVETREKMRNAAALESDDAKDLLQEVQTKNKFLTQDLDKKKAQLNAELQSLPHPSSFPHPPPSGLRQATKVATGRANSARKQCEELEDLLNRYKRKVKGKKTRTTGRSSPTKELRFASATLALISLSQSVYLRTWARTREALAQPSYTNPSCQLKLRGCHQHLSAFCFWLSFSSPACCFSLMQLHLRSGLPTLRQSYPTE